MQRLSSVFSDRSASALVIVDAVWSPLSPVSTPLSTVLLPVWGLRVLMNRKSFCVCVGFVFCILLFLFALGAA